MRSVRGRIPKYHLDFLLASSHNYNLVGLVETWETVWFRHDLGPHFAYEGTASEELHDCSASLSRAHSSTDLSVLLLKLMFHQMGFWTQWANGMVVAVSASLPAFLTSCEASSLSFRSSQEPVFKTKACWVLNLKNGLWVLLQHLHLDLNTKEEKLIHPPQAEGLRPETVFVMWNYSFKR